MIFGFCLKWGIEIEFERQFCDEIKWTLIIKDEINHT